MARMIGGLSFLVILEEVDVVVVVEVGMT